MLHQETRALIIGGGFGGIQTALNLEAQHIPNLKITLVSNKSHFEYLPTLYRVITGKSPLEVCIPIRDIFEEKRIEFCLDTIISFDPKKRRAHGESGSTYQFDYAILALGSETAYFNIPGLSKHSFTFKSVREAIILKNHLHTLFEECKATSDPARKVSALHFVIVGGGPTGIELAGELSEYARALCTNHGISRDLLTIDILEGASRILPMFPKETSEIVKKRLHELQINVFTNRPMVKEELDTLEARGVSMSTQTVIWTAGVKPHSFYGTIKGFVFDQKGRVLVNEYLEAQGNNNIFVIGDGASTPFSGMAQTAVHDGNFVASVIGDKLKRIPILHYKPKKPYYSLPIGSGWAITSIGPFTLTGYKGWIVRRLADLRYFISILSFKKAFTVFQNGKILCETCEICNESIGF